MLNGETSHRWPYFLPDGQHFLYFAGVSTEVASMHVAALDSSDTKLLFPARSQCGLYVGLCLQGFSSLERRPASAPKGSCFLYPLRPSLSLPRPYAHTFRVAAAALSQMVRSAFLSP